MNFLPIEVRKQAEKMYLKGFKQNQIAKKLGVTEKTVTRWILPLKQEYPRNHLKIKTALKLFGYGHSIKAIAKKIKVTEKTVSKWLNYKFKIMKIEEVEAMVGNFNNELLAFFEMEEKELKSLTVQKVFEIISKRKNAKELSTQAKTSDFWNRVNTNMHLFLSPVISEIKKTEATFTKEQKADYFFNYLDKNTKD